MHDKARVLSEQLDGCGVDEEYDLIRAQKTELGEKFPELMLATYRISRKWRVRVSCVFFSIHYARDAEAAVQLGLQAIKDRSKVVRYRACMLLAWSLRSDALPALREALATCESQETKEDLEAAIDAIENNNSNYFVDRDHSGRVTLNA